MTEQTAPQMGNGKAIGISVLAAGVLGAIGSSLFGRKESRTEQVRNDVTSRLDRLETMATQSLDQLTQALEGLKPAASGSNGKKDARKLSKSAVSAADSALKATRQRIAEIDREAARLKAIERANAIGHDGSVRASELARTLGARASAALEDSRSAVPGWKSKASRTVIDARSKGTELALQARATAPGARDKVTQSASELAAKGSTIASQAREHRPEVLDTASKALGEVAGKGSEYASQVRAKTPDARDRAGKAAHEVAGHVKELAPEVRERASKAASVASEKAAELSVQARERAPEVLEAVNVQLHSAVHGAHPLVDEASHVLSRAVEQAKDAGKKASETLVPEVQHKASDASSRVSGQGHAALAGLNTLSSNASDRIATTTGNLEHKTKSAATAAGRGTKDATALVGWSLAAAGVIYYALLNETQRGKVSQSAKRIGAEIRDVYQDIRGYDGEFK